MKVKHKDYLIYEIPNNWTIDEDNEYTTIYNDNGNGALVLSFYTIMEIQNNLDEHISIMAKKFIKNNLIKLNTPLILDGTNEGKKILYGTGETLDNDFFKIWLIAKYPKVIIATYNSKKKTQELKCIDKIINSFQFKDL